MLYIPKNNEIEAIQIKPENYETIARTYEGFTVANGHLIKDEGTRAQDEMWIVEIPTENGVIVKQITDATFSALFKKKPEVKYSLAELALRGNKARLEEFPAGDYVEWSDFAWVINMGGIKTLYSPTPEELAEKVWLIAE